MPKNRIQFSIAAVKPLGGARLQLRFADSARLIVDLTSCIESTPALSRLRNPRLFASAKRGPSGRTVEFGKGSIDLASDNLRNLATEQAGGIGHERIWNWMHENELTIDEAAEALGISRRMLVYYRNAEKVIPKHIWLACVGWETVRKHSLISGIQDAYTMDGNLRTLFDYSVGRIGRAKARKTLAVDDVIFTQMLRAAGFPPPRASIEQENAMLEEIKDIHFTE